MDGWGLIGYHTQYKNRSLLLGEVMFCIRPAVQFAITAASSALFIVTVAADSLPQANQGQPATPLPVTVHIALDRPAATFRPDEAFGAGVDGHDRGSIAHIYTKVNMKAMLTAGFKPLTYRLRTELGVEAWHWNPRGKWSDKVHKRGYWISDARPAAPIRISNGYCLPRRGNTIDQANNKGYSRLTDGDTHTFWKSNPYLDTHFTSEHNAAHPQWVMVLLDKPQPVDTIRLLWANPYAVSFSIEYYTGSDPIFIEDHMPTTREADRWKPFPLGTVRNGKGGLQSVHFAAVPFTTRCIRVLMKTSSYTATEHSTDVRDRLGYALREVWVGRQEGSKFLDLTRHGKSPTAQTVTYASSTDPWHRAEDIDLDVEQPGFDLVYRSPLKAGQPMLIPVAPLYDTPENAAAEINYLTARGYDVSKVEIGEEPDGQSMSPEDYAVLYIQFAQALHKVDPRLKLGGPSFQTSIYAYVAWPDATGNTSWMNRFLAVLRGRHHLQDFNFFSFEWYPFDNVCLPTSVQLASAPDLLSGVMKSLRESGVSTDIPWLISEYGYSSFAGQAEVEMPGAIINADTVMQFLAQGGTTAYFYGYEPTELIHEEDDCNNWGNLALFLMDENHSISQPLPAYYGARMLTQQWALPGHGLHTLFAGASDVKNSRGQNLISAYAVSRPDGQWSLMLLNKDPKQSQSVKFEWSSILSQHKGGFTGTVTEIQYSEKQYVWHPSRDHGHASPDLPPAVTRISANENTVFLLPPYSMTLLRGSIPSFGQLPKQ